MAAEIRAEPELATAEPTVIWSPGSNPAQRSATWEAEAIEPPENLQQHDAPPRGFDFG